MSEAETEAARLRRLVEHFGKSWDACCREAEKLRGDLVRYGRHLAPCAYAGAAPAEHRPDCGCGLDAALNRWANEEEP